MAGCDVSSLPANVVLAADRLKVRVSLRRVSNGKVHAGWNCNIRGCLSGGNIVEVNQIRVRLTADSRQVFARDVSSSRKFVVFV